MSRDHIWDRQLNVLPDSNWNQSDSGSLIVHEFESGNGDCPNDDYCWELQQSKSIQFKTGQRTTGYTNITIRYEMSGKDLFSTDECYLEDNTDGSEDEFIIIEMLSMSNPDPVDTWSNPIPLQSSASNNIIGVKLSLIIK